MKLFAEILELERCKTFAEFLDIENSAKWVIAYVACRNRPRYSQEGILRSFLKLGIRNGSARGYFSSVAMSEECRYFVSCTGGWKRKGGGEMHRQRTIQTAFLYGPRSVESIRSLCQALTNDLPQIVGKPDAEVSEIHACCDGCGVGHWTMFFLTPS